MFKKGSLSLSINAIVVLILAVTMLGLGLLFMQNMMGGAMGQLSDVSDSVKDQMIERIRSSNEKLAFDSNDFAVRRSGNQEYYYGILNQLDSQKSFDIYFACDNAMGENLDIAQINRFVRFEYIPMTIPLPRNEIDVQKVIIRVDPQAVPTTYRCAIFVGDSTGSPPSPTITTRTPESAQENLDTLTAEGVNIYAQRYFFVTVS